MTKEYNLVIELLNKLSSEEREQVRKRIIAYPDYSSKKKNVNLQEVNDDYILSGILYELEVRGMKDIIPSNFYIKNKTSFNSYWEGSNSCRKFLEKGLGNMITVERLILGRICARSLALQVINFAPISLDSMLNNVRKIPEALDKSFPGYIQAGLLQFLLRARFESFSSEEPT